MTDSAAASVVVMTPPYIAPKITNGMSNAGMELFFFPCVEATGLLSTDFTIFLFLAA